MTSINFEKLQVFFFNLKLCIKYNLINHIVNNIILTQNLTCVLKTYKTYNPMVRFSK